jgi:hypothetical protein
LRTAAFSLVPTLAAKKAKMDHPFDFSIPEADKGSDQHVSGSLTEDEYLVLRRYLQLAEELTSAGPFRTNPTWTWKLDTESGPEPRVVHSVPGTDEVATVLHRLRPFVLPKEPTYFYRIANIVGKSVASDYVRQLVRHQRKLYNGTLERNTVQFECDGVTINSEEMLADWLNGLEYHQDEDRRARILPVMDSLPDNLVKDILICTLMDKAKAIRNLASIAAAMVGKTNRLPSELRPGVPEHLVKAPLTLLGRDCTLIVRFSRTPPTPDPNTP